MGKGEKKLQNVNYEIELLEHDLDDSLWEKEKLHKQNNSTMDKVIELMWYKTL